MLAQALKVIGQGKQALGIHRSTYVRSEAQWISRHEALAGIELAICLLKR